MYPTIEYLCPVGVTDLPVAASFFEFEYSSSERDDVGCLHSDNVTCKSPARKSDVAGAVGGLKLYILTLALGNSAS